MISFALFDINFNQYDCADQESGLSVTLSMGLPYKVGVRTGTAILLSLEMIILYLHIESQPVFVYLLIKGRQKQNQCAGITKCQLPVFKLSSVAIKLVQNSLSLMNSCSD